MAPSAVMVRRVSHPGDDSYDLSVPWLTGHPVCLVFLRPERRIAMLRPVALRIPLVLFEMVAHPSRGIDPAHRLPATILVRALLPISLRWVRRRPLPRGLMRVVRPGR